MKIFTKAFFQGLRAVLGPILLLRERLSHPKGLQRPQARQAQVDQDCQGLALYQYQTCPFCIKVRQEMRRLSLPIQHLDAQAPGPLREELLRESGQTKVPCLKITDPTGHSQWLQDSEKIMAYLRQRFTTA